MADKSKIDEITWHTVTQSEYNSTVYTTPHRETYLGGISPARYEVGTFPTPLPTKQGAIVRPSKEWLANEEEAGDTSWADDTFFMFDGADWSYVSAEDGTDTFWGGRDEAEKVIRGVLDAGGTVVFEGWDQ